MVKHRGAFARFWLLWPKMCRPDRALLAPHPAHDCGSQQRFSRIRQVIFLPYWLNIVQEGNVQFCSSAPQQISRREFRTKTKKSSSESDDEDALRCARGASER